MFWGGNLANASSRALRAGLSFQRGRRAGRDTHLIASHEEIVTEARQAFDYLSGLLEASSK
jgi:hypothetical protein